MKKILKLKTLLFALFIAFLFIGCGAPSSSENASNNSTVETNNELAAYIAIYKGNTSFGMSDDNGKMYTIEATISIKLKTDGKFIYTMAYSDTEYTEGIEEVIGFIPGSKYVISGTYTVTDFTINFEGENNFDFSAITSDNFQTIIESIGGTILTKN